MTDPSPAASPPGTPGTVQGNDDSANNNNHGYNGNNHHNNNNNNNNNNSNSSGGKIVAGMDEISLSEEDYAYIRQHRWLLPEFMPRQTRVLSIGIVASVVIFSTLFFLAFLHVNDSWLLVKDEAREVKLGGISPLARWYANANATVETAESASVYYLEGDCPPEVERQKYHKSTISSSHGTNNHGKMEVESYALDRKTKVDWSVFKATQDFETFKKTRDTDLALVAASVGPEKDFHYLLEPQHSGLYMFAYEGRWDTPESVKVNYQIIRRTYDLTSVAPVCGRVVGTCSIDNTVEKSCLVVSSDQALKDENLITVRVESQISWLWVLGLSVLPALLSISIVIREDGIWGLLSCFCDCCCCCCGCSYSPGRNNRDIAPPSTRSYELVSIQQEETV